MRAAAFAVLAVVALLAGCAQPQAETAGNPSGVSGSPSGDAGNPGLAGNPAGNGTGANESLASGQAANRTFPPQEHDVSTTAYAVTPAADTGNMGDLSWQVDVPAGARKVSAAANLTQGPTAPVGVSVGTIHLMIHAGTMDHPGTMIADASGDLKISPTAIPAGAKTLVIMCHVDDTAGAEVNYGAHLRVQFA